MIRQLRKRFPETEVVVMTMEESPLFAQRAIDAGATGFVVTDRADTELVTAVRLAARGQEYVSARVASGLEALHGRRRWTHLRETEIVRDRPRSNHAEIAGGLHLSRRTVETTGGSTPSSVQPGGLVQFALTVPHRRVTAADLRISPQNCGAQRWNRTRRCDDNDGAIIRPAVSAVPAVWGLPGRDRRLRADGPCVRWAGEADFAGGGAPDRMLRRGVLPPRVLRGARGRAVIATYFVLRPRGRHRMSAH